jgi:hypothetical protein
MLLCSPQIWNRIRWSEPAAAQYCAPLDIQAMLFPALVRAGSWFTPTLTSWRGNAMIGDPTLLTWLNTLPGSATVWPDLRNHWADMTGPIPTAFEGRWRSYDWGDMVRAAVTAADLPAATVLYTLRHSWITTALTSGMGTLDVARLAGTSLLMIERHYGHLVSDAARLRLENVEMIQAFTIIARSGGSSTAESPTTVNDPFWVEIPI